MLHTHITHKGTLLSVFFVLIILFLFPENIYASILIDKSIVLTSNIIDEDVIIASDNLVFDCNGYTISIRADLRTAAIKLTDRQNVTIKNCIIQSFNGIELFNSNFNDISNNTFLNNGNISIFLYQSDFNEIINNYFDSDNVGIEFNNNGAKYNLVQGNSFFSNTNAIINASADETRRSDFNNFISNIFDSNITGLIIDRSKNLSLIENRFINSSTNSILITGEPVTEYFIHNIESSNTINGKPIYYFVNESNKEIPSDASFVGVVSSSNIIIKNLELTDKNNDGILLVNTNDSRIENVKIANAGIRFINSNKNIIEDSEIESTITLDNSSENQLKFNTISAPFNGILLSSLSSKNLIESNSISFNNTGVVLNNDLTGNIIRDNTIFSNRYSGITYFDDLNDNLIYHNNIYNNERFNIEGLISTSITQELSFLNEGNYWGHDSPPCFYRFGDSYVPYDANDPNIVDSYPYCKKDGWYNPPQFWAEVQNTPQGTLNLRASFGVNENIIKTVPDGWVVKVISSSDENGNPVDLDNYRWYQVEDVTDGAIGWMAGLYLQDGTVYLAYNEDMQDELEKKAQEQLDTRDERMPIVLDSVDTYYSNTDLGPSLYATGGGSDGKNDFQKFIAGSNFPKELALAIVAQETGGSLDNEICSGAKDGGIGIIQITSLSFKGLGSGLDNYPHKNDCDKNTGWIGDVSKYYSNTLQGIYANIKDGFRVLQEKYRKKCPKEDITIKDLIFSCQDIEKILTVWGYNGFARDENGSYVGNYLSDVANKLEGLDQYFTGIGYDNSDKLIEKLRLANSHKKVAKLYSPAQLQVIDSQNQVTGVVGGEAREDIPNSAYDPESETAAIFFSEDSFRYQVVGTSDSTYGLTIGSDEEEVSTIFEAAEIPIVTDAVHEYSVDWELLSQGEKGVTVEVDSDGDGSFDYQFQSSSTLYDVTKPETQAILSGNLGKNNWYRSDVEISLVASDNKDGVGVLKTEYSLEDGNTWNLYAKRLILSTQGVTSIWYRSQDFLGNLEDTKILEIKIDKTPPEALLYFDIANNNLKIEGKDNMGTSEIRYGEREVLLKDEAGNTLKLFFDRMRKERGLINTRLEGLAYNGFPVKMPQTSFEYEFVLSNKERVLKDLEQKIKVKSAFNIHARYHAITDKTAIEIRETEDAKKHMEDGLVIVYLFTKKGTLGYFFKPI